MKLERTDEADALMAAAMDEPDATVQKIHQYGRRLLNLGRPQKALEVFEFNRAKFPQDNFTTIVGLARGYQATGDS